MVQSVKATYRNGVLEPLEELDLEDGESVVVTISGRRITERDLETMRSSFGSWRGRVDAEKLIREIYEARIQGSAHKFDDLSHSRLLDQG